MAASISSRRFRRIAVSPSPQLDLHYIGFHLTSRDLRTLNRALRRVGGTREAALMKAIAASRKS